MTRSANRIPRLRTRGRANRARLLREAERLLAENTNGAVRFSDVFEAAGVSRGSAYRIYIGMDDLIQDLAGEWLHDFIAFLAAEAPRQRPDTWMDLSDYIVERAGRYWGETAAKRRMTADSRPVSQASYDAAVSDLARYLASQFERYFVVPRIPDWHSKVAFFTRLCDLSLTEAIRAEGGIDTERLAETQALCRTHLSFYLSAELPAR